ncbi:mucin-4-like [Episyrphus balteatus]|uniref:mucin-4-like n=1 Tax=Episyrphus balteatus TaxID=286459 RepID=UPI002486C70F|nr:mucin-4-like [Episyrphus balteatus]
MKIFLVLTIILAVGSASVVQFSPTLYTAAIPITTQYHAQDGLGQYSYGYSGGPSAKAEYKSLDGVTRGSYSYVDADGELQTVEYTADSANGFQASATNLPKAPIDDKTAPKPVEDTPEVAMAKAEHLAAFREAELRAAEQPEEGEGQAEQSSNGSQEASSREAATSPETESPNRLESSSERTNEPAESSNGSAQQSSSESTSENGNGNGNAEITRLSTNGLTSIGSGLSNLNGLNLNSGLSLGSLPTLSDLSSLRSLQLNGDLSSNDAMRFSEITPATTSQLRPLSLTSLRLPSTSYLRVSTPTHGYSIISPSILTAVPTLRATSSQTISRTLPISLTSSFLTQGLH